MKKLPWYFATRALGVVMIVFGLFGDHTGDRSTIIITGAGLLGIDKVARSESGN
jgi:hypothetical protein